MKENTHGPIIRTLMFYFYEVLNDFLPETQRRVIFSCQFIGTPAIKDVIEAVGVPHTEVDLILINGKPVTFEQRVYGGELVCVYPQVELFANRPDVHLRPKPLRDIKFIVDVNLGRLASKLRLLGFNTLYKNNFTDREIVALSLREQRIILTRDKGVLKYKVAMHGYWIRDDDPNRQLKEVVTRLQLHKHFQPFTRCSVCNTRLQPIDKALIKERLADDTLQFIDDFMLCPGCKKIYWRGSHYERFRKYIDKL